MSEKYVQEDRKGGLFAFESVRDPKRKREREREKTRLRLWHKEGKKDFIRGNDAKCGNKSKVWK